MTGEILAFGGTSDTHPQAGNLLGGKVDQDGGEPLLPPGATIAADAISVREALSNLIHNALAHGARTRLTVAVEDIPAGFALAVTDDGPGIPPEARGHLCEPFQKSAASHGSGLGLAIAAEVARAHGGALVLSGGEGAFRAALLLPEHPAGVEGTG
jgi:two-component system sensor histidine kinase TctE